MEGVCLFLISLESFPLSFQAPFWHSGLPFSQKQFSFSSQGRQQHAVNESADGHFGCCPCHTSELSRVLSVRCSQPLFSRMSANPRLSPDLRKNHHVGWEGQLEGLSGCTDLSPRAHALSRTMVWIRLYSPLLELVWIQDSLSPLHF